MPYRGLISGTVTVLLVAAALVNSARAQDRTAAEYVVETQKQAKLAAEWILRDQLMGASLSSQQTLQSLTRTAASEIPELRNAIATVNGRLEGIYLDIAALDPDSISDATLEISQQLSATVRQLLEQYVSVVADKRFNAYRAERARLYSKEIASSYERIVDRMGQLCAAGVPLNLGPSGLPYYAPPGPGVEIKFNYQSGSDGSGSFGFSIDADNERLTPELKAMVSTFTAVALTSGNPYAIAAAVVVQAVIYVDSVLRANDEAEKAANSAKYVFENIATSDTVRVEYKRICQGFNARLRDGQELVEALRDPARRELPEITARRTSISSTAMPFLAAYQQVQLKLGERRSQIAARPDIQALAPEERESAISTALEESAEKKEYDKFLKNGTMDVATDVFVFSMVESSARADEIEQLLVELHGQAMGVELAQLHEALSRLTTMSYLQSLTAQNPAALNLLRDEAQANAVLFGLLKEWQFVVAEFVSSTFGRQSPGRFLDRLGAWDRAYASAPPNLKATVWYRIMGQRRNLLGNVLKDRA